MRRREGEKRVSRSPRTRPMGTPPCRMPHLFHRIPVPGLVPGIHVLLAALQALQDASKPVKRL
jgi:hypothetical protein